MGSDKGDRSIGWKRVVWKTGRVEVKYGGRRVGWKRNREKHCKMKAVYEEGG